MRTRLLITTTAALLAGTVFAAAQSVQNGDREKAGANQGQTMQRPAGKEQAAPNAPTNAPNRNAQTSPAQGQPRGREQPTTSGQGNRDQDAKSLDNKSEGGRNQTQRQPDNKQQQGQAQRPGRTEGQAPREQGQNQRDQDRQQGQIQRDQDRQQGQNQREPERSQQGAQGERGGGNVNLSSAQRTKIRESVFNEKNAPRVGKVDFSLREGTVVPRSVRIVEVPQVLIDIHPEWRRYRYFIANEEIVIVDPETLRIIAIVEV